MKTLKVLTVSVIFLALALAAYLEFDKKRFDENLPVAPEPVSESLKKTAVSSTPAVSSTSKTTTSVMTPDTPTSVNPDTLPTPDIEAIDDSRANDLEFLEGQADTQTADDSQDSDSIHEHRRGDETTTRVQGSSDPKEYLYHTPSTKPDPIYSMSAVEQEVELARRRQRLIEDFGDTPEVRIIIKHFYSRVIPRGSPMKFKGEEGLEILRAMSVLWPIESTLTTYESLKSMQENGWHSPH